VCGRGRNRRPLQPLQASTLDRPRAFSPYGMSVLGDPSRDARNSWSSRSWAASLGISCPLKSMAATAERNLQKIVLAAGCEPKVSARWERSPLSSWPEGVRESEWPIGAATEPPCFPSPGCGLRPCNPERRSPERGTVCRIAMRRKLTGKTTETNHASSGVTVLGR